RFQTSQRRRKQPQDEGIRSQSALLAPPIEGLLFSCRVLPRVPVFPPLRRWTMRVLPLLALPLGIGVLGLLVPPIAAGQQSQPELATVLPSGPAGPRSPERYQQLARQLLEELVEINTTASSGDNTAAAEAMRRTSWLPASPRRTSSSAGRLRTRGTSSRAFVAGT